MTNQRGYIRSFEPVQIAPGAPVLVTISFECTADEAQALGQLADKAMRANLPVTMQLPDEPGADRVCANCAGTGWYSEEDKIPCNECAAGDLRCASSENRTGDA